MAGFVRIEFSSYDQNHYCPLRYAVETLELSAQYHFHITVETLELRAQYHFHITVVTLELRTVFVCVRASPVLHC